MDENEEQDEPGAWKAQPKAYTIGELQGFGFRKLTPEEARRPWGQFKRAPGLLPAPMLSDQDPMPFGKYAGLPMAEVPAEYLLSLKTGMKQYPELKNYIKKYRTALRLEMNTNDSEQGDSHGDHSQETTD